jgi:hypothetical protein
MPMINSQNVRYLFSAMLVVELLFLIYIVKCFVFDGMLPAPFFFMPSDTFMDFYNTNYWSLNDGRYDVWQSIYPVSVFLLGRSLTPNDCDVVLSSLELRDCASYSIISLILFYFIAIVVCAKSFVVRLRSKSITLWIIVFFAMLLVFPGLFALERGNYILVALMFLALSELYGLNWKGAVFLALAINIKQYLLILWFVPFFKKDYRYLLTSVTAALLVNELSVIVLSDNNYFYIFDNMFVFSNTFDSDIIQKVWYSTSLSSWEKFLIFYADRFPSAVSLSFGFIRGLTLFLCLVAFCVAFLKASVLSREYLSVNILMCMLIATDSAGGYSFVLLLPYLYALVIGERYLKLRIFILFVLFIPFDFVIGPVIEVSQFSYLSNKEVDVITGLTLGAYIRPIALVALMLLMIYPTLTTLRKLQ